MDDTFTETRVHDDLSEYGAIEHVAVLTDKRCAFVSFTTIQAAIKAVQLLPSKPAYQGMRVSFGKDNCARPGKGMPGFGTPVGAPRPEHRRLPSRQGLTVPRGGGLAGAGGPAGGRGPGPVSLPPVNVGGPGADAGRAQAMRMQQQQQQQLLQQQQFQLQQAQAAQQMAFYGGYGPYWQQQQGGGGSSSMSSTMMGMANMGLGGPGLASMGYGMGGGMGGNGAAPGGVLGAYPASSNNYSGGGGGGSSMQPRSVRARAWWGQELGLGVGTDAGRGGGACRVHACSVKPEAAVPSPVDVDF